MIYVKIGVYNTYYMLKVESTTTIFRKIARKKMIGLKW